MEPKKYSSYAEIDKDLEILRLEREIHYRKTLLSIDKTKECIVPTRTISRISNLYNRFFSGTYGMLLKIAIPYVINWFINRKRGD